MVDTGPPCSRSRPFPGRTEGAVAGLTRTVRTWSTVGGLGSGLVVESAGTTGTATGAALSVGDDADLDGGVGSGNRACSLTLVGQWSCDLSGIAPLLRNQHLRPSICRQ